MAYIQNLQNEEEKLAKPRINKVVQAAIVEFDLHGIMNSKIKDIASRAGVGEASVYRYFTDKADLVNLVAYSIWVDKSIQLEAFMQEHLEGHKNGLDMLLIVFDLFSHLYYEHKDLLKFMEQYGNFVVLTGAEKISYSFEAHLGSLESQIYSLIDLGMKDHSIDAATNKSDVYDFFILSVLPTVQNLAIRSNQMQSGRKINPDRLLMNLKKGLKDWLQNRAS